jgi:Uma2 family endonuclease
MTGIKTRPRKTEADYMRLPEGALAELIEGEIFSSPSPKLRHQLIVQNLNLELAGFVRSKGLGILCVSPLDVHLPSGDIVQPDLIFVAESNRGILRDWIRGVPDLLIEVVSPDRPERDRIVKRDLYARNGVPEYWIVEEASHSVDVLVLRDGRYETGGYFEDGDTLTSAGLFGLKLPITCAVA